GAASTSAEIASGSMRLRTTIDGLATTIAIRARKATAEARWSQNARHTSADPERRAGVAQRVSGPLTIADARIDDRVQQIDGEVGEDDGGAAHDEHREHDRIVALQDRVEREPSHAGPREHDLGHHRARQHRAQIDAE